MVCIWSFLVLLRNYFGINASKGCTVPVAVICQEVLQCIRPWPDMTMWTSKIPEVKSLNEEGSTFDCSWGVTTEDTSARFILTQISRRMPLLTQSSSHLSRLVTGTPSTQAWGPLRLKYIKVLKIRTTHAVYSVKIGTEVQKQHAQLLLEASLYHLHIISKIFYQFLSLSQHAWDL